MIPREFALFGSASILVALTACQVPEPTSSAPPAAPPELAEPVLASIATITPIPSVDGARFELIGGVVGDDASPGPIADATVDLDWQGEGFDASVPVFVTVDGSTLSVWGELPYDLQGEARVRYISLNLDAADVAAGATLPGTLVWTESPSSPPWIDVLLQASVQVEVLEGSGAVGDALSVRVMDAAMQPMAALGQPIGAAIAGELFEGSFAVDYSPLPSLDCGPLTDAQLAFVSSSPQDLGATGYLFLSRAHQGSSPLRPFSATGYPIDALTNVNGTRPLTRVPGSGGVLTVDFEGGSAYGMDIREGAGLFEIRGGLTLDGRTWGPGFGITLTRTYSTSPDGDPECTATFSGELTPW